MSHDKKLASHETDSSTATFGFWVYLMTDCVLFATLFATYVVLEGNSFGGPSAAELFDLSFVLVETMLLLVSSFTIGLALLAAHARNSTLTKTWLWVTFILGAGFLGMELYEFSHLVQEGHSWRASGFMSAYFTLLGTHGLHIAAGLLWIAVLAIRIAKRGLNAVSLKRLTLLSLFWHFLDIIWIFIFTIVYLMGAI